MSEENNIIQADFEDGCTLVQTLPVYQHSYSQIMQVEGLDLPTAFQVHFSNDPTGGDSVERIGTNNAVYIPNSLLAVGSPVYAFIFLHDSTNDGETVYKIVIPVMVRPELPTDTPTPTEQSAIDEAIAALNTAVEMAEGYAGSSAQSAQGSYEFAETSEQKSQDSEAWAVGQRNGQDVGQDDPTFHNNSKFYALVAQQGAEESGFIQFYIDVNGHLIYEHTGTDLSFSLEDGHLIVEG